MCQFQVCGIETFRETVVNTSQVSIGFGTLALFLKKACKCHSRPKFKPGRMLCLSFRNRLYQTCPGGFTVPSRCEDVRALAHERSGQTGRSYARRARQDMGAAQLGLKRAGSIAEQQPYGIDKLRLPTAQRRQGCGYGGPLSPSRACPK
jgi:hypothetical protein